MAATLLGRIWDSIAERGRTLARLPYHTDAEAAAANLASSLLSERGEATSAGRADALVGLYGELSAEQRRGFHLYLARHFSPEPLRLARAAQAYLSEPSPQTAMELGAAAEPPRRELLRRMNIAPGATAMLVQIREALIKAIPGTPELKPLEQDLHHLFASWFNLGFLELRKIDWNVPASILEKLIAYEAVHEIQGWEDLRRRLAPDRRCFAFFHPALPDEPLIFVQIALCQGLASEIAPLLSLTGPNNGVDHADAAIFYSITNCQPGLRGISFGNFLIKHVVEELRAELPKLKIFATLSPVPGFRRWLDAGLAAGDETLLNEKERSVLGEPAIANFAAALAEADWQNEPTTPALKPILQRLCASYLTAVNDGRGPSDPVARFHLGNGARLERINWRANPSARGIAESYGMMVNYRYDPITIEVNHEKFVTEGGVAYSTDVGEFVGNGGTRAYRRALAKAAE